MNTNDPVLLGSCQTAVVTMMLLSGCYGVTKCLFRVSGYKGNTNGKIY